MAHPLARDTSRLFRVEYVKSLSYGQSSQNEADLRQKVTAAFAHITPKMLRAT
jgi:hypothetical protein